jgi:hypothetical protein
LTDRGVTRSQHAADKEAAKAGWGMLVDEPAGEVAICCGDGQFWSNQGGNTPEPGMCILHTMWQRHRVLMVNEAYTTVFDYDTEQPLKCVWSRAQGQALRRLLWCGRRAASNNSSGSSFVSQDGKAARIMRGAVGRGARR